MFIDTDISLEEIEKLLNIPKSFEEESLFEDPDTFLAKLERLNVIEKQKKK